MPPTTSLSRTAAADQLTRGDYTWSFTQSPISLTYGFRDSAVSVPNGVSGFERFSAAVINATIAALETWTDVTNVTYTRVSGAGPGGAYTNNATMLFGGFTTGLPGGTAFAYLPDPNATAADFLQGDVWANVTLAHMLNPVPGTRGFQVLVHEIGHTLGLLHPSQYDGGADSGPMYDTHAQYIEDTRQYTVMSYFAETNTGANYGGLWPMGPQIDDILAVQSLYGANMATRAGDTVYGFNSNTGRLAMTATSATTQMVFAAWDAGGQDIFDFSGYAMAQTINLAPAVFSSVGGLTNNVVIVPGARIETAFGGSGNDVMTGDELGNALFGGGGDDRLDGAAGNDLLDGGAGSDTAAYASAPSPVRVNLNLTTVQDTLGGGFDTLIGVENVTGSAFDDLLVGNAGNNTLTGGAGADVFDGGLGDDVIDGGDGGDLVSYLYAGGGVRVSLGTTTAQNTLSAGTDTISNVESVLGSVFNDQLTGSAAANVLIGGDGYDILIGGGSFDVLLGGAAADYFIFTGIGDSSAAAPDIIADFQPGSDKVDFRPLYSGPADRMTLASAGPYAYVDLDLGGNGTVDLRVLFAGQPNLTAADILLI